VGNASGSNGTYNLQGGSLTTYASDIGVSGTGLLAQTGGTHTVSQTLNVGTSAGSTGTYTLANSSATLSTHNTTIGLFGTGTFTQTGGSHTVSDSLLIGDSAGNPAANAHRYLQSRHRHPLDRCHGSRPLRHWHL
jgi:fibronectin-binding autotransporter adhesin